MYEQRIRDVEMGSFTPLVFSTVGGMGSAATVAYKCLASMLSTQWGQSYSSVVSWIRCSTSFSLLRSAVTCLRGARSHRGSPVTLDLACYFGRPSVAISLIFFSLQSFCPALLPSGAGGGGKGCRHPGKKKLKKKKLRCLQAAPVA